jgi:hypothetical protein
MRWASQFRDGRRNYCDFLAAFRATSLKSNSSLCDEPSGLSNSGSGCFLGLSSKAPLALSVAPFTCSCVIGLLRHRTSLYNIGGAGSVPRSAAEPSVLKVKTLGAPARNTHQEISATSLTAREAFFAMPAQTRRAVTRHFAARARHLPAIAYPRRAYELAGFLGNLMASRPLELRWSCF